MTLTTTIILLAIVWSVVIIGIPVMLHLDRRAVWYIPYSIIIAGITTYGMLYKFL